MSGVAMASVRLPPGSCSNVPGAGAKWKSGGDRPLLTLATRALPSSRAVINEAQMVAYIAARWDVDVTSTKFDTHISDSMDLMRRTDVFIGMHGAGWTNSMFLSQVIRHHNIALTLYPT